MVAASRHHAQGRAEQSQRTTDEVDWSAWFPRLLCRAWALGQGRSDRDLNSPCSSCEHIDLRILRRKQDIGATTEAVGRESETSNGCRMVAH